MLGFPGPRELTFLRVHLYGPRGVRVHLRLRDTGDLVAAPVGARHPRHAELGSQWRVIEEADIHTLFDRGYLGVDPQHRLLVSPRLRADFSNGDQFYAKAGQVIDLPERRVDRPGREFLEWHIEEVFLKAAER